MPSAPAPSLPAAPGPARDRPDTAERLDAAAFATLALVPLGMALLNKSAPALLVAAALLAVAARAAEGGLARVGRRAVVILRRPLAWAALAFSGWALLSLGWSALPRLTGAALGEVAVSAGAAAALHLALPRRVPPWAIGLAAAATAIGAVTILAELATGLRLREALGLRAAPFIFKRPVTCAVVLYWPLVALLARGSARPRPALVAAAVGALLLVAIVAAHSGAALLGLLVALALLVVAALAPRTAVGLTAFLLVGSLAAAPLIGGIAARTFPPALLDAMERVQMRDRISIWQSFGEVAARRPAAGVGFGTSPRMDRTPVAAEVPAEHRPMLAVGHPHDGFLQISAELGLVGALLAAVVFGLVLRGVARAPEGPGLRCAALGCAAAVMLVGHGAWQGWWIATLGAAAVWFARIPSASLARGGAGSRAEDPPGPGTRA